LDFSLAGNFFSGQVPDSKPFTAAIAIQILKHAAKSMYNSFYNFENC